MQRNVNLLKLSCVLSLLAAFVLFSMPNLQLSNTNSGETIHSVSVHDVANSVKGTKRITTPAKLLLIAALTIAFFTSRVDLARSPYRTPLVKSFFLPIISLRMRMLLLRPLKFTSLFV